MIAELRLVGHDKKSPIELRLFAIPRALHVPHDC